MRRPHPLIPVLVLALLAAFATGCPAKHKEPSAEYEQAHKLFAQLYGQKGNDAFTAPEISEVERLLTLVKPDSLDAAAASELARRIAEGKARAAQIAAEIDKASAPATGGTPTFAPRQVEQAAPQPAAAVDAGGDQPTVGLPLAEFNKRFATCFTQGESFLVEGLGITESFRLKDIELCRRQHPYFLIRVVLFSQGKVYGFGDLSSVVRRTEDGGARDAG